MVENPGLPGRASGPGVPPSPKLANQTLSPGDLSGPGVLVNLRARAGKLFHSKAREADVLCAKWSRGSRREGKEMNQKAGHSIGLTIRDRIITSIPSAFQ